MWSADNPRAEAVIVRGHSTASDASRDEEAVEGAETRDPGADRRGGGTRPDRPMPPGNPTLVQPLGD